MKATELQQLLDDLQFSQRRAARELSINERTMRKYVSGDALIPKTVELALVRLRLDKQYGVLLAELDEAQDKMYASFSKTNKRFRAIAEGRSRENPTLEEIRIASDAMERFDRVRRRWRQFFEDNKATYVDASPLRDASKGRDAILRDETGAFTDEESIRSIRSNAGKYAEVLKRLAAK